MSIKKKRKKKQTAREIRIIDRFVERAQNIVQIIDGGWIL